ncbi:MAG: hypothetical protein ABW221_08390 [Vicinamibacteria bacterium]
MALLDVQTVICRALLSRRFRASLRDDTLEACSAYALRPDEVQGIRALPFDQLEKNARFIDAIRLGQVRRRFVDTGRVLARSHPDPEAFYAGWLFRLDHETNRHYENAVSFRDHVRATVDRGEPGVPPYLADLADLEFRTCGVRESWTPAPAALARADATAAFDRLDDPAQAALRPRRRHRVDAWTAAYDVVAISEDLRAARDFAPPVPRATHVVAVSDTRAPGLVRIERGGELMVRLLALCDGSRTAIEIAERFVRENAASSSALVRQEVERSLGALGRRGWLSFA